MRHESFTILVVDGNRVSRKVYGRLLHRHFKNKCKILEVENGEDGLYFCESQSIDCVLIDYHLPDMHGLEFLNALNKRLDNHYIPVVILTGQGDEATAVEAMKSGAQDYLVKGTFSQELLAQAVTNAIEKVELVEELDRKRIDLERTNQELKREIETRQAVEENLRLFRDLINQTSDALFIIDPESGNLLDFNDAAATRLGYSRAELAKMSIVEVDTSIDSTASWHNLFKMIKNTTNRLSEGNYRRKDGSEFPVEANFRYISRDSKDYLVAVTRDITERKKVEQQLRDLSNRDGLTGVYNRRFFDQTMSVEWKRLKRAKQPLAVILCDVDYFKFYNDTYGHQAGDHCLKSVAQVLTNCVNRPADFVARYGGEEFVAVLPETDEKGAEYLANDFREGIGTLEMVHEKSPFGQISASFGVAVVVPNSDLSPKALIEAADQALYQAKETGRNRVVLAQNVSDAATG